MKKVLLLSFFLGYLSFNFAQTLILRPKPDTYQSKLSQKFKKYEIVELDANQLMSSLNTRSTVYPLKIVGDNIHWDLNLAEYQLNKILNNKNNIRTFKVINNNQRSKIGCLTIADHYVSGFIDNLGIKTYIEPLSQFTNTTNKNSYIIYQLDDVIENTDVKCAVDHLIQNENKSKSNENSLRKDCKIIDIALSSDYALVTAKGGVAATEAHLTSILNQMQTWYDDDFELEVELGISAMFIPTSLQDDPWSGLNSIDAFLVTHKNWGNGGGYGSAPYAAACSWTNKFKSGSVGLAYLNGLCTNDRYETCSDFGTSLFYLGVLMAHETAHLLNAIHEPSGPYIMGGGYTGWSTQSIQTISNSLRNASCLGNCASRNTLSAEFENELSEICPQSIVKFSDMTIGSPIEWNWEFPGGNPATSKIKNPVIKYEKTGTYNVKLTCKDASGNTNTIEKINLMKVQELANANFTVNSFALDLIIIKIGINKNVSHFWDFGDGNTSNEENPNYSYIKDGTYKITYCVEGNCNKDCKTNLVNIVSPVKVNFSTSAKEICAGTKINFINLSSENSKTFTWNFEGGTPAQSYLKEPSIIYTKPGLYEVSLSAHNSKYSDKKIEKSYIRVKSSIECPNKKGKTKLEEGNSQEEEIVSGRLSLLDSEILITPNPSQGEFKVYSNNYLSNLQIECFNLNGQKLMLNMIAQDKFSRSFNISEAGEGIYFIRITTDSEMIVKKLVVRQ